MFAPVSQGRRSYRPRVSRQPAVNGQCPPGYNVTRSGNCRRQRPPIFRAQSAAQCPQDRPLYNPRTEHCIQNNSRNQQRIAGYGGFAAPRRQPRVMPPPLPSRYVRAPSPPPRAQPSFQYQYEPRVPLGAYAPTSAFPKYSAPMPVPSALPSRPSSRKSVRFAPENAYFEEEPEQKFEEEQEFNYPMVPMEEGGEGEEEEEQKEGREYPPPLPALPSRSQISTQRYHQLPVNERARLYEQQIQPYAQQLYQPTYSQAY